MWQDTDAEKLRKVKDIFIGSQKTVGGMLCRLGIKLNVWCERFSDLKGGGRMPRTKILVSQEAPGLDRIQSIEQEDRLLGVAA